MTARSLDCGSGATAFPRECGSPICTMRCRQSLRAKPAAGHSTRIRIAALIPALSAKFNLELDAAFTVALNSLLNAPVRPELAAQLAALFAARLRLALTS
jgi:hypothetical protein